MSDHIRLKQGLDLPIAGAASEKITKTVSGGVVAIKPTDFRALVPRLLVKEGESVLAGQPLFVDKQRPQINFCSPCSGVVSAVVRGDRRKLLEIRIDGDAQTQYVKHQPMKTSQLDRESVKETLLERGLWPFIQQRPYGIVANPDDTPKSIFISGIASAPLAADLDFIFSDRIADIQAGIQAVSALTKGGVHLSLDVRNYASTPLHKLNGVIFHTFEGKHPMGNVGVQINHISPINKGEVVWTVSLLGLATIGKCIKEGIYDTTRKVAITGPAALNPSYVAVPQGVSMTALKEYFDYSKGDLRIVSGDVLTGTAVGEEGFLGFFDTQISVLAEGAYSEMFGWCKPLRLKKFSFSHSYWSWLGCSKKRYDMDTNTNGGERAFVVSDVYGKVLPMDILPVYLLKACLANDIEKMEKLGIYEVVEEDLALCEYVCPSKIGIQKIISDGIALMLKEMA